MIEISDELPYWFCDNFVEINFLFGGNTHLNRALQPFRIILLTSSGYSSGMRAHLKKASISTEDKFTLVS